jgi:hypothetical protein
MPREHSIVFMFLLLLESYNLPEMKPEASRLDKLLEAILIVWIIGAQAWYYLQFREQFRTILAPILRKLWR